METITAQIAAVVQYQEKFRGHVVTDYMLEHIDIPVVFVCLYLTLIFYVPGAIMKDRAPLNCKAVFAVWNLVLTVFSILGSIHTAPVLVRAIYEKGLRYSACVSPDQYYFNGPVGFWVMLFIWSKIPELVDTLFLVVQKKDVIFLHWFHHVTVMLYCWHAYVTKISSGLWFAGMNYAVHSIMYFYYFLMAIGARSLVKPIAPLITTLQLLQMVVGMAVTAATFVWRLDEQGCEVNAANSRMGLAMYTSYFVLFALLFKKLYLTKSSKSGAKKGMASPVASPTSATKDGICNVEEVDGAAHFIEKKKKL